MADEFITIDIEGIPELKEMLNNLATKEKDRIMRKALRAGGELQKDALESFAPIRPDLPSTTALPLNALENDITLKVSKVTDDNFVAIIQPGKSTRHVAGWVEYGHRMVEPVKGGWSRVIKKGKNAGQTRGPGKQKTGKNGELLEVSAHPWIRPAFEQMVEQVSNLIAYIITSEVVKTTNKK